MILVLERGLHVTRRDFTFEEAIQLLAYIAMKIRYKRLDLLRKYNRKETNEIMTQEEVIIVHFDSIRTRYLDWESALEDTALLHILPQLSLSQQTVLWKLIIEDKSQVEIAKELNISPVAVSKLKTRAFKKIKESLSITLK